jgi:hypothetical protein
MIFATTRLFILAALVALASRAPSARAADRDDFYATFQLGVEMHRERELLAGASLGYCPYNEWGVGAVIDEHFATDPVDPDLYGTRGAIEIRWFMEPFEIAGDIGLMRFIKRVGESETKPIVSLSGAYLFALTPSLAARAQAQVQFLQKERARFFTSLGARILF